jgi:hypothetical protein
MKVYTMLGSNLLNVCSVERRRPNPKPFRSPHCSGINLETIKDEIQELNQNASFWQTSQVYIYDLADNRCYVEF